MLWYWLSVVLQKIIWLFRPPEARDIARIDPNLSCPVCGARNGKLTCVQESTKGTQTGQPLQQIFCKHECQQCGARWNEKPIFDVTPEKVSPSAKPATNPPALMRGAV